MPPKNENASSDIEFTSKNHELIIRNLYKFY